MTSDTCFLAHFVHTYDECTYEQPITNLAIPSSHTQRFFILFYSAKPIRTTSVLFHLLFHLSRCLTSLSGSTTSQTTSVGRLHPPMNLQPATPQLSAGAVIAKPPATETVTTTIANTHNIEQILDTMSRCSSGPARGRSSTPVFTFSPDLNRSSEGKAG